MKKYDEKTKKLIIIGNNLLKKHLNRYNYLRGFKKPTIGYLQNELDGGDEREVNAFELNDYRMPR